MSRDQRRVGVDDRVRVRPRLERGFVEAVAQAQDLERVRDLARPAGIDERRLVGIQHLDAHHPQVAQVGGDVLGLHRGPGHVDHVERLGEANEVAEVLEGARALAAGGVHGVGRPAHGDELGVAAADRERAVAAGQGELGRRGGDRRLHHLPPEPDLPAGDGRAGAPQEFAGAVVVDLDAQLLEHGERGGMDVGNLVVGIAPGQRQGTRQPAVVDEAGRGSDRTPAPAPTQSGLLGHFKAPSMPGPRIPDAAYGTKPREFRLYRTPGKLWPDGRIRLRMNTCKPLLLQTGPDCPECRRRGDVYWLRVPRDSVLEVPYAETSQS